MAVLSHHSLFDIIYHIVKASASGRWRTMSTCIRRGGSVKADMVYEYKIKLIWSGGGSLHIDANAGVEKWLVAGGWLGAVLARM